LPIFLDMTAEGKNIRAQSNVIGWTRPQCLIAAAPQFDSPLSELAETAALVVRYLHEGVVYGFVTKVLKKYDEPTPMWCLEYPPAVEVKNLRRWPRIKVLLPAKTTDGQTWYILDLSREGALIAVSREVDVGEELRLSFPLPDGNQVDNLKMSVVRLQRTAAEQTIGVRFTSTDATKLSRIEGYVDTYLRVHRVS
jgi:c-di-GMP-binding flagellar brake protein YcgR